MKTFSLYRLSPLLCLLALSPLSLPSSYGKVEKQATPIWQQATDTTLKRNKALPDYNKLHSLFQSKKGVTWVLTGDSITHGAMHTNAMRSYPEHWEEMLRWDHRRFDDVIINTGISGDRIGGILGKFDQRIKRFNPQVVSINIGMNDCSAGEKGLPAFKQGLKESIKKVRALNALPVLQVPSVTNNDKGDKGKQLEEYSKAVREIADAEKVLLVDHEAHWKKFADTAEKRKPWMNDAIHPNGLGHQEMFKKMAHDLGLLAPGKPTSKMGDKTL